MPLNKPPKELWKDEFKEWIESPMVRMALKALVPEGQNADLMAVLEHCFETGFEHGVTGTLGGIMRAAQSQRENVNSKGIPVPEVGHA